MPKIESLQSVKTIVCHANCPDGLASAMILHNVLPDAEIVFLQYNTPELSAFQATEGQLWCDFCPPADRYQEFVAAGAIVLDHHKSAKTTVEEFGENGVFADEKTEPGVSGALLAYRHVWIPLGRNKGRMRPTEYERIVEKLATLAGIRDTWQKQSPDWTKACAQAEALLFWPKEEWLEEDVWCWEERLKIGPTLIAKHADKVEKAIKGAYRFTSNGGKRVLMFQGVSTTSDAAEKLGDEVDLIVGFRYENDAEGVKIVYSLRSHTGFDCSTFAKRHKGGGGHTGAAGFTVRLSPEDENPFFRVDPGVSPYAMLKGRLDVHEALLKTEAWGEAPAT